jgi:hypothetical protein
MEREREGDSIDQSIKVRDPQKRKKIEKEARESARLSCC